MTTNVNVSPAPANGSPIWTASRVIALIFTVIEVVLLIRFFLKLLGANADQALVALLYAITEPLVIPFRGIFAQPSGNPVVEVAALLAIVFFMLIGGFAVAIVRAITGKRGGPVPPADAGTTA